jgi:signal transduction histidine kinase
MSQKSDEKLTGPELRLKMSIDIAHELRTPLGGIVGMNELLLSSQLDAEQKQFSETIHDSAKSMLQLLNDFVELAKLDAEKIVAHPQSTHLQTLMNECSYSLKKSLKAHNIELKISFEPGIPDQINTDENCLRQTIIAVISGATKYVETGTIMINVSPGTNDSGTNGPGNNRPRDNSLGTSGVGNNGTSNGSLSFAIVLPPNTVNRNGQPLFSVIASDDAPVLRFDSTWVRLSIAQHLLKLLRASVSISGNTLEFSIPC